MTLQAPLVDITAFNALDIRAGTVVRAAPFPEARQPALRLWVDFGALGVRHSSAQVTAHYDAKTILGRQIMAVVNLPPRQIGPHLSEVLILGVPDAGGAIRLIGPDEAVSNGARMS